MSVVISSGLSLADAVSGGGAINADNPVIGYQTRVTSANISATTAAAGFPASHLANPSTNLRWVGTIASPAAVDTVITVDLQTNDDVDYIGVARHNFGSAQIAVSIEGVSDPDAVPPVWAELVGETLLPNDQPAIFRFAPQPLSAIRIRLQPGSAAPTAAVLYVGKLLVLQRRIYVGHTPITYGRSSKVTNARSEAGHFLGRIVLNETTRTQVALQNLTPDWYRTQFDPFLRAAREAPFFFAWRCFPPDARGGFPASRSRCPRQHPPRRHLKKLLRRRLRQNRRAGRWSQRGPARHYPQP